MRWWLNIYLFVYLWLVKDNVSKEDKSYRTVKAVGKLIMAYLHRRTVHFVESFNQHTN